MAVLANVESLEIASNTQVAPGDGLTMYTVSADLTAGHRIRIRLTTNSSFYQDVSARRYQFNSNTDVDSSTDFITLVGHDFANNDSVDYWVVNGNTAVGGLVDEWPHYTVVQANTLGIKLYNSTISGVANITANTTASGANTAGHFIVKGPETRSSSTITETMPVHLEPDSWAGNFRLSDRLPYSNTEYSYEWVMTYKGDPVGSGKAVSYIPWMHDRGNPTETPEFRHVRVTDKLPNTSIFWRSGVTLAGNTGDQIEYYYKHDEFYPIIETRTVDSNGYITVTPANIGNNTTVIGHRYWSSADNTWSSFSSTTIGTGSISGFVWVDTNNNGVFSGEVGRANVVLTLSGANTGTQRTSSNGFYKFNTTNGSMNVAVTVPSGYTNTTATLLTGLSLNNAVSFNKTDLTSRNFGINQVTYTLSGRVFIDTDEDGVFDGGESAYTGGATITLSGDSSGSNTSAANGYYAFTVGDGGTYTLTLTVPGGYTNTESTVESGITISGANSANHDFGIKLSAAPTISGVVFTDTDGDGIFDGGESGKPDVSVRLYYQSNLTNIIANTTTAANGSYSFTANANTFFVQVVVPSKFQNTTSSNLSSIVVTTSNVTASNVGLQQYLWTISGRVYDDLDNDGVNDSEGGFAGVTINLTGSNTLSNTSPANGYFSFDVANGTYALTVTSPASYVITSTNPRTGIGISGADSANLDFGVHLAPTTLTYVYSINTPNTAFYPGDTVNIVGTTLNAAGLGIRMRLQEYPSYYLDLGSFSPTSLTNATATIPSEKTGRLEFNGNTEVNSATDYIVANNTFSNNLPVRYLANTAIGGLTNNTVYFVKNANTTAFQLSNTSGGSAIDLTGTGASTPGQLLNSFYPRTVLLDGYTDWSSFFDHANTLPYTDGNIPFTLEFVLTSSSTPFGNTYSNTTVLTPDPNTIGYVDLEVALPNTSLFYIAGRTQQPQDQIQWDLHPPNPEVTLTADINSYGRLSFTSTGTIPNYIDLFWRYWGLDGYSATYYANVGTGVVSGYVYVDTDEDGVKDIGEDGYDNAFVQLSGTISSNTYTEVDGSYYFNAPSGTYAVTMTLPDGYSNTTNTSLNGITIAAPVEIAGDISADNNFGLMAEIVPDPDTSYGNFLVRYINPFSNGDIVTYFVDYKEINPVTGLANNFFSIENNDVSDNTYVIYWKSNTNVAAISGLTPDTVYYVRDANSSGMRLAASNGASAIAVTVVSGISNTILIANGGAGYNSTVNSSLIFTGGNTHAIGNGSVLPVATFANNANGTITSITITGTGSGYESHPVISVNSTAAVNVTSAAILAATLDKGAGHQLLLRTPLTTLEHFTSYYVVNTTPRSIKLANTYPGSPIDLSPSAISERGHYIRRLDQEQA